MRIWITALSAFGAGIGIGIAVGAVLTEEKIREEYKESAKAYRKAMEMAKDIESHAPQQSEEPQLLSQVKVEGLSLAPSGMGTITHIDGEPVNVGGVSLEPTLAETNPYHKAVAAKETDTQLFVEGGVNDYGVSYIEEEDFNDEDGRTKTTVNYYISDNQEPVFLVNGEQMHDWDEHLGDSIVVDFYQLIPPGAPDILYVRNHKTDSDYEVVFGIP